MRVGFAQFAPVFGDPEQNHLSVERLLAGTEAELLVLPELCFTGYGFQDRGQLIRFAEPADGLTARFLQGLARRMDCHLVAGFPELAGGAVYNASLLVGPEGLVGVYRKAHLFRREKELFEPGDGPLAVYTLAGPRDARFRVGMVICFDWLFPELARKLALGGAQLICHPSNLVLPGLAQLVTRARAIENRVFWVLANRCGTEHPAGGDPLSFTGESQVVSPAGEVLARAGTDGETVMVVDVDPAGADDKRVTPENDLFLDRRTDLY